MQWNGPHPGLWQPGRHRSLQTASAHGWTPDQAPQPLRTAGRGYPFKGTPRMCYFAQCRPPSHAAGSARVRAPLRAPPPLRTARGSSCRAPRACTPPSTGRTCSSSGRRPGTRGPSAAGSGRTRRRRATHARTPPARSRRAPPGSRAGSGSAAPGPTSLHRQYYTIHYRCSDIDMVKDTLLIQIGQSRVPLQARPPSSPM